MLQVDNQDGDTSAYEHFSVFLQLAKDDTHELKAVSFHFKQDRLVSNQELESWETVEDVHADASDNYMMPFKLMRKLSRDERKIIRISRISLKLSTTYESTYWLGTTLAKWAGVKFCGIAEERLQNKY